MFERFTDRARKVMALANQEAQRFNHEYVGTEHMLLGLVKEGSGVGSNVLKNLDIDLRRVRLEVEKLVKSGPDMVTVGKLPQTPRAKRVVEYAIAEARSLNHNYVGTEHILLGLIREHDGVAAQVLMNMGLKLEDVREETLNLLGNTSENAESKGQIKVTAPVITSALSNQLRSEIAILDAKKDELIKSCDYEAAAAIRDESEKKKQQLDKLVVKCDSCNAVAKVYIIERKDGAEVQLNLCEICSAKTKDENVTYTDIFTLTPEQMKQLFSEKHHNAPDQPILDALSKIDSALVQLFAAVSDPTLEIDQENKVEVVMAVGGFMKRFYSLRERLLKE